MLGSGRVIKMGEKNILYIIIAILITANLSFMVYVYSINRTMMPFGIGMGGMMSNQYQSGLKEDAYHDYMENMHNQMHDSDHSDASDTSESNANIPVAESHKSTYDFGKIKKTDGVVSTMFEIENHGKSTLELGPISTSCGCTKARVESSTLGFDEVTNLVVEFDPNFHDEPAGSFKRSIFVKTNDLNTAEMTFNILVEIVE